MAKSLVARRSPELELHVADKAIGKGWSSNQVLDFVLHAVAEVIHTTLVLAPTELKHLQLLVLRPNLPLHVSPLADQHIFCRVVFASLLLYFVAQQLESFTSTHDTSSTSVVSSYAKAYLRVDLHENVVVASVGRGGPRHDEGTAYGAATVVLHRG